MSGESVALITGGGSGIGRATALLFAAKGCDVCIADIDEAGGNDTCKAVADAGGRAKFVHCDVSKEDDVQHMVDFVKEHFGKLDYAFNNAGIPMPQFCSYINETSMEAYDQVMGVNTRGVFMCIKYEVPLMLTTSDAPAIVVTASAAGHISVPGGSVYSMSKWALRGLVAAAAKEYTPLGLRVNGVSPGWVHTPMISQGADWERGFAKMMKGPDLAIKGKMAAATAAADGATDAGGPRPGAADADVATGAVAMPPLTFTKDTTGTLPDVVLEQTSMGRMAEPEEVASLVVWLCQEGTYVSGQSYLIDGGFTCHP